ncbi:type II toxin-antitoxin system VapC family toxin [soil metagenome]
MPGMLIDTDVFVDHLRGSRRLAVGLAARGEEVAYSLITRCELFAARSADERGIRNLLAPMTEIGIDRAIAERAGSLRRGLGLTTPDALIAATALERDLDVVSRDARAFSVAGPRWRDPAEISS